MTLQPHPVSPENEFIAQEKEDAERIIAALQDLMFALAAAGMNAPDLITLRSRDAWRLRNLLMSYVIRNNLSSAVRMNAETNEVVVLGVRFGPA